MHDVVLEAESRRHLRNHFGHVCTERWGGLFEADPQERTKPNEASSDDGTSMRTHIHTQIQTQRRRQRSRASWRVTGVAGKLGTYQRLIKLADKEAAASAVPSSSTDPRACRDVLCCGSPPKWTTNFRPSPINFSGGLIKILVFNIQAKVAWEKVSLG